MSGSDKSHCNKLAKVEKMLYAIDEVGRRQRMQKINRYPVMLWQGATAHQLVHKYKRMKFVYGKLQSVIDEYWLPGQRNQDRLLRECHERALNDAKWPS